MSLQKKIIRLKFRLTTRKKAVAIVRSEMEKTLAVVTELGIEASAKSCRVPAMLGVDRDMRDWSLLQILEHNTIVNNQMHKVVDAIGNGREFHSNFNAKTDTVPSDVPSESEVEAFRNSVEEFLSTVQPLSGLRQSECFPHPIFGQLNAHGWLCMFGLHLSLHRKQAQKVGSLLSASKLS